MKISRDPREKSIHDNGAYAANFNDWVIAVNNIKVPNEDALSADDGGGYGEKGVVKVFIRKKGEIVLDDKGEPRTKDKTGNVTIYGSRSTCDDCDSLTQEERLEQPWWYL